MPCSRKTSVFSSSEFSSAFNAAANVLSVSSMLGNSTGNFNLEEECFFYLLLLLKSNPNPKASDKQRSRYRHP
jgi:hypothetical protein